MIMANRATRGAAARFVAGRGWEAWTGAHLRARSGTDGAGVRRPSSVASDRMAGDSKKVVVVALAANLAIAAAKFVAAALTGSPALLAEAFHSLADSGNEVLLRVAQVRGDKPADRDHPFGHGREAYFWGLIAAVAVFVGGGLLSVREGVAELLHPTEATSFAAGYVVLVVALLLDGISLRQAYRQLETEASDLG